MLDRAEPKPGGLPRRPRIAIVALAVLGAAAIVSVGWPLAHAGVHVLRGVLEGRGGEPPELSAALLARSLAWAGGIGVLAVAAAWPAAWASRALPARWFVVVLVPMLMPSYLAYSGWGLARAPGTWLGDWLAQGPNWRPIAAGRLLSVVGLTLWAWPLAAIVLAASVRRIDGAVLDALRLEAPSRWQRAAVVMAMSRCATGVAVGAVALVMLGSAVPLHLAQVPTYAIELWRLLDLTPADQAWRLWAAAWPIVVIAAAVGLAVGRRAAGRIALGVEEPLPSGGRRGVRSASVVAAIAVWCASVVAPVVLFVLSVREWDALGRFWRVYDGAVMTSAAIAAAVGAVAIALAAAAWSAFGAGRAMRVGAAAVLGLMLFAALVPGVMLGSAMASAWNAAPGALIDSPLVLVVGHTARFGFVAVLAGWWLAATEPAELRSLRLIDGADSLRGWARATLPLGAAPLAGAGLAAAALSFHEIEASVVLQPPGTDSFARAMLENLHFARMEDLAAGVIIATGGGLVLAVGAAWLMGRGWRFRSPG